MGDTDLPKVPEIPKMPDINVIEKQPVELNPPVKINDLDTTKNTYLDKIDNTKNMILENISNGTKNISVDSLKSFFGDSMYIGLFVVIVVSAIIAYILYWYISNAIFNQNKIIIEGTKTPVICNKLNQIPIKEFNKSGNGKRRTYTFWIYIHDLNKYSGSYKHVFHIGDTNDIKNASPFVFLDKSENKLYFRLSAIDNDSMGDNTLTSIQNISDSNLNNFMSQGIVIPYVPIQRWVHIAVVVNENSNGGSIIAYVDGDISKIVTSGEISDAGSKISITNLNLDKMGDLVAGGSFESSTGPGFSGLISKLTMYNYDLNNKDIYDDYNKGPLDGFMAKLGFSRYGLRTPIYKIE